MRLRLDHLDILLSLKKRLFRYKLKAKSPDIYHNRFYIEYYNFC